jgi:DNA-binding IclR family transcriptional regulator
LASRYLSIPDPVLSLDDALNAVQELRDSTIVISVLDGADVVYVACRTGTQPIALQYRVGMRLPAYCAAGGKALLSSLEPEDVERRLANEDLRVRSSGKQRTLKDLTKELTAVRLNGYATDNEEVAPGMCCVGAAIPRPSSHPLAAVSVSWVKAGVDSGTTARYADSIVRLAKQLSVDREEM